MYFRVPLLLFALAVGIPISGNRLVILVNCTFARGGGLGGAPQPFRKYVPIIMLIISSLNFFRLKPVGCDRSTQRLIIPCSEYGEYESYPSPNPNLNPNQSFICHVSTLLD